MLAAFARYRRIEVAGLKCEPGTNFIPFVLRCQEIDGKALLLLRSDMMMKYMGLKLGPALKLTYHIDKLKQGKF